MSDLLLDPVTRRRFLGNASALGAASLLGLPRAARAEPPPEVTKIRLVDLKGICLAPEYVAEALLRLEGFSEVEYVEMRQNTAPDMLLANRADITAWTPPGLLSDLDAGKPFGSPASTAAATSCLPTSASARLGT